MNQTRMSRRLNIGNGKDKILIMSHLVRLTSHEVP